MKVDKDKFKSKDQLERGESVQINRRKWLQDLIPKTVNTVVNAVERNIERSYSAKRRPPGAIIESLFMMACTRCHECVRACPHGSIFIFDSDAGILKNTPVLEPDQRACAMCDEFPCATVCTSKALEIPKEKTWPLGKVKIRKDVCIAFMGPECGACVGVCPNDLNAITLAHWKPKLDQERCIGCGICIQECPVIPKAIELE